MQRVKEIFLHVDNDTRRGNSGGRNYRWVVKKEVDRRVILLCASCMSYQALYRYGLKLGPLLSYSICTQLLSSKKSQLNNQKVLANTFWMVRPPQLESYVACPTY